MSLKIYGIGTATPPNSLTQDDAAGCFNRVVFGRTDSQKRLVRTLFRSTEIDRRASVLLSGSSDEALENVLHFYGEAKDADDLGPTTAVRMARYAQEAGGLAASAARNAFADAGLAADAITHLITVSCTGFYAPGLDVALIRELKLSPDVGRLHVGFMGCHGVLNGLRAAHSIGAADPNARVLLCAVELCSLHFQYGWKRDHLVANSLFADGAAALVAGSAAGTAAPQSYWNVRACGSHLFADSEDAMSWTIGNHGFEMTLSARVPDLIAGGLAEWVDRWLGAQGMSRKDVKSWAVHPGGPKILSAAAEALGLEEGGLAVSREILAAHGNMSSPTVLFILERMRELKAPKPCVVMGFGPGLMVEAAVLE